MRITSRGPVPHRRIQPRAFELQSLVPGMADYWLRFASMLTAWENLHGRRDALSERIRVDFGGTKNAVRSRRGNW